MLYVSRNNGMTYLTKRCMDMESILSKLNKNIFDHYEENLDK